MGMVRSLLIVCRAQVFAGVEALDNFRGVLLLFAGVLVFSSLKLLGEGLGGGEEEEEEDLSNNSIIAFANNLVRSVEYYDGNKFFTEVRGFAASV